MREIKFRLIKDSRIVGYEKHIPTCGRIDVFHSLKNDDEQGWEWWNVSVSGGFNYFIEHDDKEQFTGLRDKNGKEIYEGDGLKDSTGISIVVWNQLFSSFCLRRKDWLFDHFFGEAVDSFDTEVIGNIHENPELL